MALSDPFSTTYQGSMQAGESLGQGIQSAAGSVADAMQQNKQKAQSQKQLQQMMGLIGMGKQTGAIKQETIPITAEEYNQQAEQALAKAGPQIFKSNVILTGSSDPNERMKQYQQLFKSAGIPGPKTTKTNTTVDADALQKSQKMGYSWNAKDGITFHSTETDPMTQELKQERLQQVKDQREQKEQNQQEKLEKDAKQQFISVRGDSSIANIEKQRDASIEGYSTLKEIRGEGRLPNSFEMNDVLAQLYRSRTGAAPTNETMKDLYINTLGVQANKVDQFFSGKATPATTEDIANKLENFLEKSGTQLDKMHDKYMSPRLTKPEGLSDKKWEEISKEGRGMNFSDVVSQYKDGSASSTLKAAGMSTSKGNMQDFSKMSDDQLKAIINGK